MGGLMTPLIEKNTVIPTNAHEVFSTITDNQNSVKIKILQGVRRQSQFNKSLGEIHLEGIEVAERGVPEIELLLI